VELNRINRNQEVLAVEGYHLIDGILCEQTILTRVRHVSRRGVVYVKGRNKGFNKNHIREL